MVLGSGCYSVTGVRIGPSVPPREVGCTVDFSTERRQDLVTSYEEVGAICFSDQSVENDLPTNKPAVERLRPGTNQRREVEVMACSFGGELIAAQGTCSHHEAGAGTSDGTEFGVWRKKR